MIFYGIVIRGQTTKLQIYFAIDKRYIFGF